MLIKDAQKKIEGSRFQEGGKEGRRPSLAERRDAPAAEPNHRGAGVHKQEEAGKKKSLNCGLEKKNVSQEVYSGWIMGAEKMSLTALWVMPVLE